MSHERFWIRTAVGTLWGIIVLGALKSEPVFRAVIGNQNGLTHYWCGPWGCSASISKLLAWQLPMLLISGPGTWLALRLPPVRRHWLPLACLPAVGVLLWIGWQTLESLMLGHLQTPADVLRRIVFVCVAGTSMVMPLILAAATLLLFRQPVVLGTNVDRRSDAQQPKHLSDIVVSHVDTTT